MLASVAIGSACHMPRRGFQNRGKKRDWLMVLLRVLIKGTYSSTVSAAKKYRHEGRSSESTGVSYSSYKHRTEGRYPIELDAKYGNRCGYVLFLSLVY